MNRRLVILFAVLAATAGVAAWGETTVAAPLPLSPMIEAGASIRALQPRLAVVASGRDPFALAVAAPTAIVSNVSAVPPAPTFKASPASRVIGKQQEEDQSWIVFLSRGEDLWVVRPGDTLEDQYQVAAIAPPRLTLHHLKNKSRLTIDIGEVHE